MAPGRYGGISPRGRCFARRGAEVPAARADGLAPVRTEVSGQTLLITLDRPPANAVDVATSQALFAAFDRLRRDPGLRVGVLTGAGERFFCAGWDLKAAATGESIEADHGPGGLARLTQVA